MAVPESEAAKIYSDEGRVVVSITSMKKEGDQLRMEGKLMGAWDAVMYLPPEMAVKMGKIMLNRSFLAFTLSLPCILRRRKKAIQKSS